MSDLKAGFARTEITVPDGLFVAGYYYTRLSSGKHDPLCATALAVSDGERTAVIISYDSMGVYKGAHGLNGNEIVAKRAGIPSEAVYIACTHTHTAPATSTAVDREFLTFMYNKIADTACAAIADLKPVSEMSYNLGEVKGVSFIRRYRMRDGSVQTNPPAGSPDILEPMTQADESLGVLKFKRETGGDILMVNFQTHPDTIGGNILSADWPGVVYRTVEAATGDTHCIFINGAQGDANTRNAFLPAGTIKKGYHRPLRIGRMIAGEVLKIYNDTTPVEMGKVSFTTRMVKIKGNRAKSPEELEHAKYIIERNNAGDKSIFEGLTGMEPIIIVAEASRMLRAEKLPEIREIPISAIRIGEFVICGVGGEPFTLIGRTVKAKSPFARTFYSCCTNDYLGYFPTADAYLENGYENRSSPFVSGVAEKIIDDTLAMLCDFYKE